MSTMPPGEPSLPEHPSYDPSDKSCVFAVCAYAGGERLLHVSYVRTHGFDQAEALGREALRLCLTGKYRVLVRLAAVAELRGLPPLPAVGC